MSDVFSILDIISEKGQKDSTEFEGNLNIVRAHTVAMDATDSCAVTGRQGYKWIREQGMKGGVFQVPGLWVPDYVDLPVLVAYSPKAPWRRMIIGVDWDGVLDLPDYAGEVFIGNHASTHEWPDYTPGNDTINIWPRSYAQLRTYPGSSGLTISISPHRYVYQSELVEFDGLEDQSLAAYQPSSGYAVRLLVYLDMISNSIQITTGTTVADSAAIVPQPPSFPNSAIYSALIRLDGDQSVVAEADILDVRTLLDDRDIQAPTAEGQIMISNDGTTFDVGVPVVDSQGRILVNVDGYIVVV